MAAHVMTATMRKAKSLTLVGIAYVVAIAVGAAPLAATGLAGGWVRFAVRRGPGEPITVRNHPPVDDVLDEADAGNPIDHQRDSAADCR